MDEFVYMTENGYTKDEILKGERIILQTLDFTVSSYCSPYSCPARGFRSVYPYDYTLYTGSERVRLMQQSLPIRSSERLAVTAESRRIDSTSAAKANLPRLRFTLPFDPISFEKEQRY